MDAASFRHYGTKANVILPMRFAGAVTGMLSFATTGRERDWPPELVTGLEFVARIFTAALGRREAEDHLHASELRLDVASARMLAAVDVAALGVYQASRLRDVFVLDTRSRELLGVPAERTSGLVDFWLEHVHADDREELRALTHELTSGRVDAATREYRYLHHSTRHHLAQAFDSSGQQGRCNQRSRGCRGDPGRHSGPAAGGQPEERARRSRTPATGTPPRQRVAS